MTATTNNNLTSIEEFPSAVEVAKIWQQKGTQLANLGKYTEALNYLNRAITIHEDNPTALEDV